MSGSIRNIGIMAHVDAGKTTLTEYMLLLSGSIRAAGNVDKGTSRSDGLAVERQRGISVRASTLSFSWRSTRIHLLDTPGHVDFAAEVERSLRVLDGAVLVLSAVEGIQAQTRPIWDALQARGLPVVLFINKIDRLGADVEAVFTQIREEFSTDAVLLNRPFGQGGDTATVEDLLQNGDTSLIENIAAQDDALLESYLADAPIDPGQLQRALATATAQRALFPVLCGAAKTNTGVEGLLDAVVSYLPPAPTPLAEPASGVVFRLDHDAKLGRVASIRLFSGRLRPRDRIHNATADRPEQITQVKKITGDRYEDVAELQAGDIGLLCGMPDVKIGDILGDPSPVPGGYSLNSPLLTVQVIPTDPARFTDLAAALEELSSEDPHLAFSWFVDERELHLKIMGPIQTEILTEILKERYGVMATFSPPTVVYRETPLHEGIGADSYTMPKPCWAIVKYRIEPGVPGSGIAYTSEVSVNDIGQKYQNEIADCIDGALQQGIKGWEVTDLKVTLVGGSDHVLHSRPGNFKLATYIALLQGLQQTDTRLLEPILAFRLETPAPTQGKVAADIIHMRGSFEPPVQKGDRCLIEGRLPLATAMDYAPKLSALSGGRASLSFQFGGYEACPDGLGVERAYKGISPLDRSKYILKMRGAITLSTAS
jgi:ribosomal protection tetracycline resistance protein